MSEQMVWLYKPTEIVNFQRDPAANTISNLKIRSDYTLYESTLYELNGSPNMPNMHRMPSLEEFNTGNLVHLELSRIDVMNMHRIPESVQVLTLTDTTVSDLRQININWENISILQLSYNPNLNDGPLIVPNGVKSIILKCQRFSIIRLPKSIQTFRLIRSDVDLITGQLPSGDINIIENYSSPVYDDVLENYDDRCYDDLNEADLRYDAEDDLHERILRKWHFKKRVHIAKYNRKYNYQMYLDLGSTKHRIRNPVEHQENPIVAAVFLGSNYLRRAAEFMTEETIF
jgi:hypothetical protein